ncbi:flagellar hook protein FlgE [Amorphus sp. 3PC139-8]|uniref:flagellar hook protein FlgE n=1 Tax=Amorphus sp. 3PC139-8 TaxID=2735676 RepID=UPI00345CE6F3
MSLYGLLRTSVSGMNAQSTKLSTIGDNVANSDTAGYKRASTEFSSLLMANSKTNYNSGSVVSSIRYAINEQGALSYTTSSTDLAVQGDGFFVVNDPTGMPFLTRAGSFTRDGNTGNLVNAAGFTLMGYDISEGDAQGTLNGYANLVPIDISAMNMQASASTTGIFTANLPSDAGIVAAADLPSTNAATADYTAKSSIVVYDDLGSEVVLDIYFSKSADSTWEAAVYDQADATPGSSFPYSSAALATQTMTFDANGNLTSAGTMTIPVPGGQNVTVDISKMTQLATDYTPLTATVDGSAPSTVTDVEIGENGIVQAIYENGSKAAAYRIPLADVPSPDKLQPMAGNIFSTTLESGDVTVGFPTESGLGSLVSGALEQSNVDLATEFTEMIVAQRSYTGNSKVFQTGNELLDTLMNLKR